ncbi:MAG: hypothetical protein H6765_09980 [Candidatus Peribacteria bacterium]|nr:MAG: hypothetical protein H6765_09980 [Candidatus Peribacteria bacterium]
MPGNLLAGDTQVPVDQGMLNATKLGLHGERATIVCSASLLHDVIQLCGKQEAQLYDVFALVDYSFEVSQALSDSLEKTQHLIAIIETDEQSDYLAYIKHKCLEAGYLDISITWITPRTEHLNKLTPE